MTDRELICSARGMARGMCVDCHKGDCLVFREVQKEKACDDFLLEALASHLEFSIPHKVIIAGSRSFSDYSFLKKSCAEIFSSLQGFPIIISGDAAGADRLGVKFATSHGIPVLHMPADWNLYGKRAGMIRNRKMLEEADRLIAFWDGQNPGTANMIQIAQEKGIPVHIFKREEIK